MVTGENGILTQVQRAKSETENAQKNEEGILYNYSQYIEGSTNGGYYIGRYDLRGGAYELL